MKELVEDHCQIVSRGLAKTCMSFVVLINIIGSSIYVFIDRAFLDKDEW